MSQGKTMLFLLFTLLFILCLLVIHMIKFMILLFFPRFIRVYPSAAFQARALASFLHAQGWSRVFVVFSQVGFVQYNQMTFLFPIPFECSIFRLFFIH